MSDLTSVSAKAIDIRKVFKDKNPGLARIIPGFIYSYLERIAHQDELNGFMSRHGHEYGVEFAKSVIEYFNITIVVNGEENLPKDDGGKYIFASNHPLGGIDGIMLMVVLSRHYKEFRILANDILMNIKNLVPLFVPINMHGKQASEAVNILTEAFESDIQIATFPAGMVSRKIKGQVMDLEWKKNFITRATKFKRDVVPVHFTGRSSDFFFRLANIRKAVGIKANIEMLYLVDETYRHQNETVTLTFGQPISYTVFDNSKTPLQWAKYVKEKAYALGGITNVPL